ncbi:MAG TPA: prolyl oligopeptidase family serine peptidase [Roseiflexaceae bacterium]|nr:prolyl oligopeptidase family serine peptidase [Roseiflexaceae bacterium]
MALVLLLCMLFASPAFAADAVESTLVVVGPGEQMPADVLNPSEVDRIGTLQQQPTVAVTASEVSPDDSALVIQTPDGPALMSVETGEQVPLPAPSRSLGIVSPQQFAWRDNSTLAGISAFRSTGGAALALLSLDTGKWSVEPLPFPAESLVSLAPNASRVLIALIDDRIRFQVYDFQSGQFQDVGDLDLAYQNFTHAAWSQDGSRLAYVLDAMPDRMANRQRLNGVLINSFVGRDVLGRLPPAQNPALQRNELRVFDFANATQDVLPAREGDGSIFRDVSWSTDGQTLMTLVEYPGRTKGRVFPSYYAASQAAFRFYSSTLHRLNQLPIADPLAKGAFISPDEIVYQMISGTNLWMYYYNRVSGEVRRITNQPGSFGLIGDVRSTRHSQQLIFDYSSFTTPTDMYRLKWDGTALYRLTWNNEELHQVANLRMDAVSFRGNGGATYSGWLVQAADQSFPPKNKPIVVWQEGGPLSPMFNRWDASVESPFALLPNFGFAVLVVPLQGRYGSGGANLLALADGDNYGQIDIDAQADIVRQMIARGWTRPGSVGITGCSYGGYFTLQSVVRYPTLYSAANPQCGLYDMIVEWNRGYPDLSAFLENGTPLQRVAEFQQDSPAYNTDKIKTPLLIFHGQNDFLPVNIAENFFQTVKDDGVPARMLKFIGTGHGITPASLDITEEDIVAYERYAAQEQIRWFRTYLKQ